MYVPDFLPHFRDLEDSEAGPYPSDLDDQPEEIEGTVTERAQPADYFENVPFN